MSLEALEEREQSYSTDKQAGEREGQAPGETAQPGLTPLVLDQLQGAGLCCAPGMDACRLGDEAPPLGSVRSMARAAGAGAQIPRASAHVSPDLILPPHLLISHHLAGSASARRLGEAGDAGAGARLGGFRSLRNLELSDYISCLPLRLGSSPALLGVVSMR